MNENRISFNFNARYYDNGLHPNDADQLLFAFHGQGQLGRFFIRKFETLKQKGVRVIVPEGLSRYYLEANQGRVGASWMTSEDRLSDIENYLQFINTLYEKEISSLNKDIPVTCLGFSQGAATVSRWICQSDIKFNRLILWAGLFPPDLDLAVGRDKLRKKKVFFIYGKNDPYMSDSRFVEQEELSRKLDVSLEVIAFDGVHAIDSPTLENLF